MKTRRTWRDKLTKKELKHLKEAGITTLTMLKTSREEQRKWAAEHPDFPEPCFDCRHIALKLGIEPETKQPLHLLGPWNWGGRGCNEF